MTDETKQPADRNDPRSHYMLRHWQDDPKAYEHVHERVRKNLEASLAIAMSLPEGEARIMLLSTLNTAIADARRRQELQEDNRILREQLTATRPEVAQLTEVARTIKSYGKMLQDKFKQVYDMEAKRGTDMWQTGWPWYEHELYVYIPGLVRSAEALAGIVRERAKADESAASALGLDPAADTEEAINEPG